MKDRRFPTQPASRRTVVFWTRLVFTTVTLCVIAAIVIQDHTSFLPLGVFNTGAATFARLGNACLALAALALIAQITELATGRLSRVCGAIRGVYVFVFLLDVLLVFGDRFLITGNPTGRLGQYYEATSAGGEPVILKKDFAGTHHNPCPLNATHDGPRILFLGDSYTEGSGHSSECNYPDVVESVLRETWNADVRVVNAGVSGYGPVEAAHLLRWYRDRGCPLDAIVYNLVLENDFADNLPATERRAVAGIIFRFPRSWFLRTFHPLNTRTFRWALVIVFFGRASTQDMLNAVTVGGGGCNLDAAPMREASPFLRASVEQDMEKNRRVAECLRGRSEAAAAIGEMRAMAADLHVPFVLVVFPDRVLVDTQLQKLMEIGTDRLAASMANRAFADDSLRADGVIDVSPVLTGREGMYRAVDTHLSDLGNVVAGRYVAEALAGDLGR